MRSKRKKREGKDGEGGGGRQGERKQTFYYCRDFIFNLAITVLLKCYIKLKHERTGTYVAR